MGFLGRSEYGRRIYVISEDFTRAAGVELSPDDQGKHAVRPSLPDIGNVIGNLIDTGTGAGEGAYVVVHPGTSAPTRTPAERHRQAVRELAEDGHRVVVTGKERELIAYVAHDVAVDLGGRTTLSQLAALIERAGVLVAGNTGTAHLAAVVGTPAVSLFAPRSLLSSRWAPYGVPPVFLGDRQAPCQDARAPRSVAGDKRAGGQSSEGADQ
ncbi:glycosyltransferase family 9 protein [Nonomuraea guangzhouensis]|uniref:Glycosyltransferase family 9 protein n=1 Tax=Nonomuraea guangzhouensis TaxID=1291555 RepID=A0ABW4GP55_9ACTN|nr:glycosyltransferase family 9 protein [Nonomuraea guangzhouensis]